MCCLETKVKVSNSLTVSKKINRNWSWIFNYDYHANGRIWIGWDPDLWHISVHSKSAQQITCLVTFIEKQMHFMVTFVYAFNKPHQRLPL